MKRVFCCVCTLLLLCIIVTGCEKGVDILTPALSEDPVHISDDESEIAVSDDVECFDDPQDVPEWWYSVVSVPDPDDGVPDHNFILCDEDQEEIMDEDLE